VCGGDEGAEVVDGDKETEGRDVGEVEGKDDGTGYINKAEGEVKWGLSVGNEEGRDNTVVSKVGVSDISDISTASPTCASFVDASGERTSIAKVVEECSR
jgi:hypothetical protein